MASGYTRTSNEELSREQAEVARNVTHNSWILHEVQTTPREFISSLVGPVVSRRGRNLGVERKILLRAHLRKLDMGADARFDEASWDHVHGNYCELTSDYDKLHLLINAYIYHDDRINFGTLRLLIELMRYEEWALYGRAQNTEKKGQE